MTPPIHVHRWERLASPFGKFTETCATCGALCSRGRDGQIALYESLRGTKMDLARAAS